jgi:hypothetical protein
MTLVRLAAPTFILGTLYPAGFELDVNLSDYGLKTVDDTHAPPKDGKPAPVELAPNLLAADTAGATAGRYVAAAVLPTGPNPTKPQSVPGDAVQLGDGYFVPAEDDEGGAREIAPEGDGPDLTILEGSVTSVKAALDGLDLDHLQALRAAEAGSKNRPTALSAIDAEITAKTTPAGDA